MKKMKTLSNLLTPDYFFEGFEDITPAFLKSIGVSALLIDIDNTLAPYEEALPNERVKLWFENLRAEGISASLISNNNSERVERFNRDLGLFAYPHSHKPSTKMLIRAMDEMGSTAANTASIGDQLLTDALAAHRLGLPAIIVPPIKDKKNLFFRFKRMLEKPYIRKYHRKQEKTEND